MPRPIKILDANKQLIGELMTASDFDIIQYIAKGLTVIDTRSGDVITESDIVDQIGSSDCSIIID
jgi:hypothetical protein